MFRRSVRRRRGQPLKRTHKRTNVCNKQLTGGLSRDSHTPTRPPPPRATRTASYRARLYRLGGQLKAFLCLRCQLKSTFRGLRAEFARISTFDRPDVPPARFDFSQIAWIIISGVRRSPSLPVRSRLFLVRWLFRLGSDNCLKCHWCECCETFFGRSSGVSNGLLLFTGRN